MVKIDFLSFGNKKKSEPLDDAEAAAAWYAQLLQEFGAGAHQKVIDLLAQYNQHGESLSVDTLGALLKLDELNIQQHQQLGAQYLLNGRLPKLLEEQLRARITNYDRQIVAAYRRFLVLADAEMQTLGSRLRLAIARTLHYLSEQALWHYYRHEQPGTVFWESVNQLFACAEKLEMDAKPVVLFGDSPATTVHDLYLSLLMVAVLSSGNLSARQVSLAYQMALLVSNRATLQRSAGNYPSFVVDLDKGQPPGRVRQEIPPGNLRYWNTAEVTEQIDRWGVVCESGVIPVELKGLMMTASETTLLRYLTREWAERPYVYQRAERVRTESQRVEVAHRLTVIHRLVRELDEGTAANWSNSDSAAEEGFRVYGFVSSRRREKYAYSQVQAPSPFPFWELDNKSASGIGVNLPAHGNEWVSLGALMSFREMGEEGWSIGLIRRLQRPEPDRVYLGIHVLTSRPVAASLHRNDGVPPDAVLPADMIWNRGEIALFVPLLREDKKLNTLLLSVSSYNAGRELEMRARGKNFQIRLGRVLEKGVDWCQVEIELIKAA
ncbi:hypothetical protein [Vogesella sp. LIG4]|uniref:hypothetical protein n=1 Tax=Vogesella sp. LIG4 TaxID=1192162 RepID=UPI00081FD86D|nr:hypothetical protein [Vogesella sp. LIG4]SCK30385.1 hypothetical protein PSELUDRAFT_3778 [Vogesella sp. LIG4]